jgi:choline dehydrogenase-like flavoprotein
VSRYNRLRFGPHYRRELDEAKNLTTYLWGNVVNINRHPSNPHVTDVSVRTLSGKRFTVRGRYFVLALGGIENARMLLLSRDIEAAGLGNGHDLVGRYFMEHILYWSGMIMRAGTEPLFDFYSGEHPLGDVTVQGHIALPDDLLRDLQIPFYRAELDVLSPSFLNTDAGRSARILGKNAERRTWPKNLGRHLINILSGLDDVVEYYAGETESFPALYVLENYVEQVPNPDSRIGLARRRDALGLNRATLRWHLSRLDKTGIQKAQQVIATEVGRSGFGRMRFEMPEEEVLLEGARGGSHHMGTTRMHDQPRQGVVDADCCVHGLNNLYVAGSSVFPTVGYINPTLTIVALTIRLGDHLKKRMNS